MAEATFSRGRNGLESIRDLFASVAGAAFVSIALRYSLVFAAKAHWSVAALLALLLAIGGIWITLHVKHSSDHLPPSSVIPLLSLGLFTLAVVGAWVSYTLQSVNSNRYTVPPQVSVATFVDLYLYTFVDLLPAVNVWETLHVKSAIQANDRIAGAPILAFKVFVVFLLFDAFRTWLQRRQEATVSLAVAAAMSTEPPVRSGQSEAASTSETKA